MTIAQLIVMALKASIIVIVFALGLKTAPSDWVWLLRRPALLARSLIAMNVIMPLFAIAAVKLMHLNFAVAVALIALSLSPVPPLLPRKEMKAGGGAPYAADLLAIAAALSIIWIPIAIEIVERVFGVPLAVSPWSVAKVVGEMVLIPLVAGAIVGRFARARADRIAPMLAKAGGVVLTLGLILILFKFWRAALGQIGDGTLIAFAAFIVVGLVVGHFLGGPNEGERTVLALSSASRHPGMALAIAHLNFPDEHAVPAAILLYLLVSALITLPYVRWRKLSGDPPAAA
jgi:BASS family bile acid:Na+ symporter